MILEHKQEEHHQVRDLRSLVGRNRELMRLRDALRVVERGGSSVVTLEGPSGAGKSFLLEYFLQEYVPQQALMLRGQGIVASASQPLQILSSVMSSVARELRNPEALDADFVKELTTIVPVVVEIFPELRALIPHATHKATFQETSQHERTRYTLSRLLASLGTTRRPVVIVLDDYHWADEISNGVVSTLINLIESSRSATMLILVARTGELSDNNSIHGLAPDKRISLLPLSEQDLIAIMEQAVAPVTPPVAELVLKLSGGNPFMIEAVLRGLLESGAIFEAKGSLLLAQQTSQEELFDNQGVESILISRICLLPYHIVQLLKCAAIIGKNFNREFTIAVYERMGEQNPSFQELLTRHFVVARSSVEFSFVHDKIREAVLQQVGPAELERISRFIAEEIEEMNAERVFEIAYYYNQAVLFDRALPYAMKAAALALARYDLDLAEVNYRIAAEVFDKISESMRLTIAEGLADVLLLRGKYTETLEWLDKGASLSKEPLDKARIQEKISVTYYKRGETGPAIRSVLKGLAYIGRTPPQWALTTIINTLWELFIQFLHTLFPRLFIGTAKAPLTALQRQEIRLLEEMLYPLYFECRAIDGMNIHLKALNLVERYGSCPDLARAYAEHGMYMGLISWYSRGKIYGRKAIEVSEREGDLARKANSIHFLAVIEQAASEYHESLSHFAEAATLAAKLGDRWESHMIDCNIGYVYYRLGNLHQSIETSRTVFYEAMSVDNVQAAGPALSAWAKASGGAIPLGAIEAIEQRAIIDIQTRVEIIQARAIYELYHRNFDASVQHLITAADLLREKHLIQDYVIPVYPWLVTAHRLSLLQQCTIRKKDLRVCKSPLWLARIGTIRYKNIKVHTMRERALFLYLEGDIDQAYEILDEAVEVASILDAQVERELCRLTKFNMQFEQGEITVELERQKVIRKLKELGADGRLFIDLCRCTSLP